MQSFCLALLSRKRTTNKRGWRAREERNEGARHAHLQSLAAQRSS